MGAPMVAIRRNAFQETLVGLHFTASPDAPPDIFSQACVESFDECDMTRFGYAFTQMFEPAVLYEVALLEGVPYESLTNLDHRPTAAMTRLAEFVHDAAELPVVGLVNLASALISVSRFDLATRLVAHASQQATTSREEFEIAWLEFLISNRRDDGADSPSAFGKMRKALASGVPRGRMLDACTQAVVWYIKRQEVPQDEFTWWMALGAGLLRAPDHLDSGTVSSWYRGVAMVPAARGNARETRRYMQLARDAAEETIAQRPRASEMNTIKTYYESAMKEHLYVTRDFDSAEEAGLALIALDPAWSPSYGELAAVYQKMGKLDRTAELCEQAAQVGAPYVGHHLLRAATCHESLGNDEHALAHYLTLAELTPRNERVLTGGLQVARRMSHESRVQFERALEPLRAMSLG